jgi:hypothetical protein
LNHHVSFVESSRQPVRTCHGGGIDWPSCSCANASQGGGGSIGRLPSRSRLSVRANPTPAARPRGRARRRRLSERRARAAAVLGVDVLARFRRAAAARRRGWSGMTRVADGVVALYCSERRVADGSTVVEAGIEWW